MKMASNGINDHKICFCSFLWEMGLQWFRILSPFIIMEQPQPSPEQTADDCQRQPTNMSTVWLCWFPHMMLFCLIFLSLHIQIPNPSPLDVVFLLGCRITNPAKSWTFIILTCRLHWWLIGTGTCGHWGLGSQVPQPTCYQVRRLPQYFQLQTLLDSVVGWMPLC